MKTPTIGTRHHSIVLAVLTCLAALLMLPPATATALPCSMTTTDQAYVSVLQQRGIANSGGPCAMISVGRQVASDIDYGIRTPDQETLFVYQNTPASITIYDAGFIVGASVAAYAPWDVPLVAGNGNNGAGSMA
jgi:Protein of unknown function (DUF732)